MDERTAIILLCFMAAVTISLYVQFLVTRATKQRIAEMQDEIDDLKRRL